MLVKPVTKPAGTVMLSPVVPIGNEIGRWMIAVNGPLFRNDRSGESTPVGEGGASGRTTSSIAPDVVPARGAVSALGAGVVFVGVGTTSAGRAGFAVSVRLGA